MKCASCYNETLGILFTKNCLCGDCYVFELLEKLEQKQDQIRKSEEVINLFMYQYNNPGRENRPEIAAALKYFEVYGKKD